MDTSPQCRLCGSQETVGHILSSCKTYQWMLYKERHDRVLYQLVKAVTKSLGLMLPERFQGVGGVVKSGVMGTAAKRILIDQAIPTDKILEHKRPDLTRVVIFEMACASDPLVGTREKEKRTKYQELAADLVNQWPGFRAIVIQAILRAPLSSVGPGVSVFFPPRVGFAGAVVLRRERQSKPGYPTSSSLAPIFLLFV